MPDHPPANSPADDPGGSAPSPTIRAAQDRFVESWGRMGSAWGISRTMAEVHALLYIVGEPLCADDIIERLNISRGNASMTLRSLTDWGIVHRAHKRGDRKEYFHAEMDVSTMLKTIARERKKRELDPVVATLFDIRDMTPGSDASVDASGGTLASHNRALDSMLEVFQLLDHLAELLLTTDDLPLADALGSLTSSEGSSEDGS